MEDEEHIHIKENGFTAITDGQLQHFQTIGEGRGSEWNQDR
jgi:hypothetical protein